MTRNGTRIRSTTPSRHMRSVDALRPENEIDGSVSLLDAMSASCGSNPRKAPKIAPARRWHVIVRAPHAAGGRGLTIVRSGARISIASAMNDARRVR